MKRIDYHAIGVASGQIDMFSAFEEGSPMWTGEGPRLERQCLRFDQPFVAPPAVHVGFAMWDISVDSNQRVDLRATDITRDGFCAEFRTWGDTRVARVRINWLAIGPLAHLDDFDLD